MKPTPKLNPVLPYKLCIRKVVDKLLGTVGKREREDKIQDGGARKSGVTHATGYTCRKSMRGYRGRKSKSRQRQRRRSNWLNKIIKVFRFRESF